VPEKDGATPAPDGRGDAGKAEPKTDPKKKDAPARNTSKGLYGLAKGVAHVDVASGTVTHVKLTLDLDVEMTIRDPETKQEIPAQSGGTIEATLKRTIVAQGR
jgi:hypothetical protein